MHYFVDGYNLLFRVVKEKMTLESKRNILLKTLASLKLNLTIVFDSKEERYGIEGRSHWKDLEIVYTEIGQSADAYIKQQIAASSHPRRETVITSDRELSRLCAHLGAHTLTIETFLEKVSKLKKKNSSKKNISFKESDKELARLLSIFESRLNHPPE